jgi:Pyridoxamine 5'-phosphate oxidase
MAGGGLCLRCIREASRGRLRIAIAADRGVLAVDRFFISTTRDRVKYKIFRRDPRVELIIDDATGMRYARVSGTVEILEDVPSNLPMNRAIREKHGLPVPADEDLTATLIAENRVLLAVTPGKPASEWSVVGVEA